MEYWREFSFIGLLFIFSFFLSVSIVLLPSILPFLGLSPRKANPVKLSTYECGPEPIGRAWVQFNFRYYFYALLFLLFDIEVIFFYPWAVIYGSKNMLLLAEMFIFIAILIVGYVYAWKKGVLEWK